MDVDRGTTSSAGHDATLRRALEGVRLRGAIFLRAEYRESWSYESPPARDLATLLRPGRSRLVLFHVVSSGRCWVEVDGDRHWADRGDVIVLPYGDQHRMGGPAESACVPIGALLEPPPWAVLPVIRHGGDGSLTEVVCGYLESDDPLFDPTLGALPPAFVVRPRGAASAWVEASVDYAMAASKGDAASVVATRLPELLLIEVLGTHLSTAPAAGHGWLAALRHPVLARAVAAMHRQPARRWTIELLASEARVSRSLLDRCFREVLGSSPMRYLREWRMHVARELLATTDVPVHAIARRVGYDAEAAFSRAFKRHTGRAPTSWRALAGAPVHHLEPGHREPGRRGDVSGAS